MTLESLDARNPSEREFGTEQTCNRVGISDVLLVQGTRMEERLDDAINVLRNHAESQLGLHLGPVGPHGSIYSHTSPPQLDHLVRIFVCRATTRTDNVNIHFLIIILRTDESSSRGDSNAATGLLLRSHAHARHRRFHQNRKVTRDECQ